MRHRRLLLLGTASLSVIIAVTGVLFVHDRHERHRLTVAPTDPPPLPFDSDGWASGSATLRHGMARRLIARGELTGRSQGEIIEQLGTPDGVGETGVLDWRFGERQDPTGVMWNYYEYLRVCSDEHGVCREVLIWDRD